MPTNRDRAVASAQRKILKQYRWLEDVRGRAETVVAGQVAVLRSYGVSDADIEQMRQEARYQASQEAMGQRTANKPSD